VVIETMAMVSSMMKIIEHAYHEQHGQHRYIMVSSFVLVPKRIPRQQPHVLSSPTTTTMTIITTSSSSRLLLLGSTSSTIDSLEWAIVQKYSVNRKDDVIDTKSSKLLLQDTSVQKYCQRMNISTTPSTENDLYLTVPLALMIFDNESYPSLSKAWKAC
jgi:hypothetical protein